MAQNFLSDIKFGDNIFIRLGDGSDGDLRLYHDATHSYIDGANTGDLYIRSLSDDVVIQGADDVFIYTQGGEDAIIARGNAGVEIYYNNSKKFETTNAGIKLPSYGAGYLKTDADGNVSVDTSTIEDTLQTVTDRGASTTNRVTFSNGIDITGGSTGADIYINNTSPTLGFTDTNSFGDANDIYIIRGTSGDKLQFQWYDDSASTTTETFNIDSSGNATFAGNLGINGLASESSKALRIKSQSTSAQSSAIEIIQNGTGTNAIIRMGEKSTDGARFHMFDGGNEKIAFYTDGTDNHISAGQVGIGLSSPASTLHVLGPNAASGGITLTSSIADNTQKVGRIKTSHYDTSEEPFTAILTNAQASDNVLRLGGGSGAENAATDIRFYTAANNTTLTGTERLHINESGLATFTGNVSVNTTSAPVGNLQVVGDTGSAGRIYISDVDVGVTTGKSTLAMKSGAHAYYYNRDNGNLYLGTNDDPNKLVIGDTSATFSGGINFGDSHFIGNDSDDNLLIQSSAGENIYIDSADDIILDAAGSDIKFQVGTTHFGTIKNDSSHLVIEATTADKDIIFKGTDNTTEIDALRLDMSEGGKATFTGNIIVNQGAQFKGTSNTNLIKVDHANDRVGIGGAPFYAVDLHLQNTNAMRVKSQDDVSQIRIEDDDTTAFFGVKDDKAFISFTGGTPSNGFFIDSSGNGTFAGAISCGDLTTTHTGGGTINIRRDDTSISDGDVVGLLNFQGDDPTNGTFNTGAAIKAVADGSWQGSQYPAELLFQTRNQTGSLATSLTLNKDQSANFSGNIIAAFDSNNSGNRLRIADTEGISAGVRTYSTSDGTGLILNHYYAVSGSPYMRYSDFVSNMGDAAATTMRFLTKPHNGNPTVALSLDNSQNANFANVALFNDNKGINFGNSNAKIYGSSADGIKFNAGGSEAMRLNQSGNLGINDVSPSKGKLQIDQESNTLSSIQLVNTAQASSNFASYPISIFFGDEQKGSSARHQASINAVREAWSNSPAALTFKTSATVNGATEKMRITSDGNVGINVIAPSRKFQIDSTNLTDKATAYFYTNANHTGEDTQAVVSVRSDNASSTGDVLYVRGDGTGNLLTLDKGGSDKLVVDDDGNATFAGHVKAPFFTSDGGRGFKQDSVAFVGTFSNGADANGENDIGKSANKWRDGYFSGTINTGSLNVTSDIIQTNSTSIFSNGAYLEIGTGASNTAQLTFNADYDGGQTATYTPHYAGAAIAGMSIIKMPSGGVGGLEFYVKKHGTTGGSHALSTFTKLLNLHQDGYATFSGAVNIHKDSIDGLKISRTSGASENIHIGAQSGTNISSTTFPGIIKFHGCNVGEIYTQGNQPLVLGTAATPRLTIAAGGDATFAGIVEGSRFVATGQNTTHGASRLKISQENTTLSELRFYGADTSTAGALRFIGSSSDGSVGGTRLTLNADGSATFTDGVIVDNGDLILGEDAFSVSADYVGMKTSHQSGTNDYMIISGTSDGSTYVSSKSGSTTYIRAGGNHNTHQLGISSTGAVFSGDLQVNGNLIVTGTSTSVNVEDLNVEQGEITLNYNASSDTSSSANGAGIRIQDAVDADNDATISWDATNDEFDFSHGIAVLGDINTSGTINIDGIGTNADPVLNFQLDSIDAFRFFVDDSDNDQLKLTAPSNSNTLIATFHQGGSATFEDDVTVKQDLIVGDQSNAASTQAFGAFDQLRFDNSHSSSNVGPNKIVMHDNGGSWIGGFGIHSDTVSYYTGGTHKFYKTTSQSGSTELFNLNNSEAKFSVEVKPSVNNSVDLGVPALRWQTVYTTALNASGAITLAGTLTNNVAQANASPGNTVTLTKINSNNAYTEYTGFLGWTYSGTGSNPYTFNLVFESGNLDIAYEVVLRTGRNGNWRNFGAMKDFGYIYNESDGDFKHNAEGDVSIASSLSTARFSLDSDPVGFGATADNQTSDPGTGSGNYTKFIRRYSFNFENNLTGSNAEWEIYVKVYNFAGNIKFLNA